MSNLKRQLIGCWNRLIGVFIIAAVGLIYKIILSSLNSASSSGLTFGTSSYVFIRDIYAMIFNADSIENSQSWIYWISICLAVCPIALSPKDCSICHSMGLSYHLQKMAASHWLPEKQHNLVRNLVSDFYVQKQNDRVFFKKSSKPTDNLLCNLL